LTFTLDLNVGTDSELFKCDDLLCDNHNSYFRIIHFTSYCDGEIAWGLCKRWFCAKFCDEEGGLEEEKMKRILVEFGKIRWCDLERELLNEDDFLKFPGLTSS
jgi:hypothetical protein